MIDEIVCQFFNLHFFTNDVNYIISSSIFQIWSPVTGYKDLLRVISRVVLKEFLGRDVPLGPWNP